MHPSLNAEFDPPSSLTPKKVMGRNELCWCGSGKKWKKCHRDRHLQQEVPVGKLMKEMYQNQKQGTCLHPEASKESCSSKLIKAHTIQRASGLSAISEKGHVISPKKGFENIFKNNGQITPVPIGIGNASTFMGFCSYHDNALFEPIESTTFTLNHQAAFLLAFRALSYEYLTKMNSIKTIEIQRNFDKGKDFQAQAYIQNYLHTHRAGIERGMKELEVWKTKYDKMFLDENFESMPHYAVEFDGILPFVCSGGFYPEIDFEGNTLQRISRGNFEFEHVCVNVSVVGERSFLAFGWHGANDGPARQFVKSFRSLKNTEKANASLILAVEQLENTYFNPTWWDMLSSRNREHLIHRMRSGIGFNAIRLESTFQDLAKIISGFNIVNEVGSM
ncbi:hypothetical protein EHN06_08985 [Marinobacter sp. NP-4(2019)]|uniref:SEC-C domain-containing protein n=1 Tax=Marinobacter sp. NP-4(2019) TaxID=2488665 RepID=UPI000FC3EC3B|nr:SEC-C domain-containing protein [Marinobacter sp. NP-4(2019)]AZT83662.1 hypothetical protein EHN06_08985 [Marinobacter sp. NP-4(2019)]